MIVFDGSSPVLGDVHPNGVEVLSNGFGVLSGLALYPSGDNYAVGLPFEVLIECQNPLSNRTGRG